MLNSLHEQEIHKHNRRHQVSMQTAQAVNRLQTDKVNIEKGGRQGHSVIPKLFAVRLESILRKLMWETTEMKINGEHLNYL